MAFILPLLLIIICISVIAGVVRRQICERKIFHELSCRTNLSEAEISGIVQSLLAGQVDSDCDERVIRSGVASWRFAAEQVGIDFGYLRPEDFLNRICTGPAPFLSNHCIDALETYLLKVQRNAGQISDSHLRNPNQILTLGDYVRACAQCSTTD